MMMKTILAGAVASVSLLSTSAMAATIADGDTFCESANYLNVPNGTCDAGGNADLSNNAGNPSALTFAGSGTLIGFVADNSGTNAGQYPDYATITLDEDSIVSFNLFDTDAGFDARFTFGSLANEVMTSASGVVSFFAAAGDYAFGLNATDPTNSRSRLETSYEMNISAVPLPAGMVLLLTGIGGLAAVRRKRTA